MPCSCCDFVEACFKVLPILPIIYPETGKITNTNKVSFGLKITIVTKVAIIVTGSLNATSKKCKIPYSTSCTSLVSRVRISPFR